MKKSSKPIYNNIEFDSYDEVEFYQWCEDAIDRGVIFDFTYQPESFILCEPTTYQSKKVMKTKTKIVSKSLLRGAQYTCDFKIKPNTELIHLFPLIQLHEESFYIDIKGGYIRYNDAPKFSIIQKWMWDKHKIYINKIVNSRFFKKMGVPFKALHTPKQQKIKKKYSTYNVIGDMPWEKEVKLGHLF